MSAPDSSAEGRSSDHDAEKYVDLVEFYDDGEWHVVLMDGSKAVATGFGESPEAARRSLLGRSDLS